jgi:hypothetical protein
MEHLSLSALRKMNDELTLNLVPQGEVDRSSLDLVSPNSNRLGLKMLVTKDGIVKNNQSEEAIQGLIKEFLLSVETSRLALMYSELKSKHHNLIEQSEDVAQEVRNFLKNNSRSQPLTNNAAARVSLPVLHRSQILEKKENQEEFVTGFYPETRIHSSPVHELAPINEHVNSTPEPIQFLHQSQTSSTSPRLDDNEPISLADRSQDNLQNPLSIKSFQKRSGTLRPSTQPLIIDPPGSPTSPTPSNLYSEGQLASQGNLTSDDLVSNLNIGASMIQLRFAGILFLLSVETERLRYCLDKQDSEYADLTQDLEERNFGLAAQNQELEELVFRMDERVRLAEELAAQSPQSIALEVHRLTPLSWPAHKTSARLSQEKEVSTLLLQFDLDGQAVKLTTLSAQVIELQAKIAKLNAELEIHKDKDAALMRESLSVESLSNQVMRVQELLEERNKELDTANEELVKTLGELEAIRSLMAKEKSRISKLETQLEELDLTNHRIKEELLSEQQKSKKQTAELFSERQKREAGEFSLTDKTKRKSLEASKLSSGSITTRGVQTQTNNASTEIDGLSASKLKLELDKSKQLIQDLEHEMQQTKLEVAQAALEEIESLQQAAQKEAEAKQATISSLSSQLEALQAALEAVNKKSSVDQSDLSSSPTIGGPIKIANQETNTEVEDQFDKLNIELAAARLEIQKLTEDLDQTKKDLRSAAGDSFRKDKEIEERKAEIKVNDDKLRVMKREFDEQKGILESKLTEQMKKISDSAIEIQKMIANTSDLQAKIASQLIEQDSLNKTIVSLQAELESSIYEAEMYKSSNDKHEKDNESLLNELSLKTEQFLRLQKSLEDATLKFENMQEDIRSLKNECSNLKDQNSDLKTQIGLADQKVKSEQQKSQRLEQQLKDRDNQLNNYESEIKRLRSELESQIAVQRIECTPMKVKHVRSEELPNQPDQVSPQFYQSVKKLVKDATSPTPAKKAATDDVVFLQYLSPDNTPDRNPSTAAVLNILSSQLGDSLLQSYLPAKKLPKQPLLPDLCSIRGNLHLPQVSAQEQDLHKKKVEDYTKKLSKANSLFPGLSPEVPGYTCIKSLETALGTEAATKERYRIKLEKQIDLKEFSAESGTRILTTAERSSDPQSSNLDAQMQAELDRNSLAQFFHEMYLDERTAREQADKRGEVEFRRRQTIQESYAVMLDTCREQSEKFDETYKLLVAEIRELREQNPNVSQLGQLTRLAGSTRSGGSHSNPANRNLEFTPVRESEIQTVADPIQNFGYSSMIPIFGVANSVKNRASVEVTRPDNTFEKGFLQQSVGMKNFSLKKVATHVEAVGTGKISPEAHKDMLKKGGMTFGSLDN